MAFLYSLELPGLVRVFICPSVPKNSFKGATTLSIMTLIIMTLSIMTLSIMTLSIMTLSIMMLSIGIKRLRQSA